jgi:hypothetical protein
MVDASKCKRRSDVRLIAGANAIYDWMGCKMK